MSATEELRRLLDERGVEYEKTEDDTTIYYDSDGNRYTYNVNPDSGWAQLFGYNLTPEQAIDATLGSGKLTAEQVRGSVERVYLEGYSDGSVNRGAHIDETDWQAIADELNSRAERTCKLDANDVCSSCGACIQRITHSVYEMGDGFACYPKYCPNCGAKAVKR